MEKPRSLFYMGPLGGALYSVGGWIAPDTVTRSVERYVPTEDTWERVSSLDVGLHEHAGMSVQHAAISATRIYLSHIM